MPVINSNNSWSPLKEVWLGDVYPAHWYSHLADDIREPFEKITEITKEDLNIIEQELVKFGITVRRPNYKNIEDYTTSENLLLKPQICPRDHFVVLGSTLIGHKYQTCAWQHIIDEYLRDPESKFVSTENFKINGANIVRLDERLIIDTEDDKIDEEFLQKYQVELVHNGGHIDGCFATLKPGLILASKYFNDYEKTFPNWDKIFLNKPEFSAHKKPKYPQHNGKWFIPDFISNTNFNQFVVNHAQQWVGDYTETFFDLNCLVLDESNVMMLGENIELERKLKQYDITVHWVPFRCRSFWDGGLHCLTLDIRRQ